MANDELIADLLKELETIKGRVKELIAAMKASEARVKELKEALRTIDHTVSWELNPSNYDHQDVCDLNASWIDVGNVAQEALKGSDA